MFVAVVSFLVNLATALLFFLVSIGDLTTGRFFTSFYILKVAYTTGDGPQSGLLNEPYNVLTFGLWNYCEGMDSVINACSDPEIGYTLDSIPSLNVVDQQYVSDAVRNFEKVTILYIPALTPRFRKRWLHAISAHLLVLATLSSILLLVVVFTVNGSRRIQFEEHVVPDTKVTLGPGVWITLALVPLTVFGSLFSAFAVCCPGRFERSRSTYAEEPKEGVYEPSL
ncbi:hypothetical protein BGZ58_008338 [Dissophora ornata]|nr:hypothetical protein BGZ58_008338 [Dissophora ornata]